MSKVNVETPHMERIRLLLKLQERFRNLDEKVEEINDLKNQSAQEEKKYLSKKSQHDKHYPYLEKVEKEHADLKQDIADIKFRIEELEEKKKKIKTIKEFKAVNKEIDVLNKRGAIKENDFITKGEELEFRKNKIASISESINEIKVVIDKIKEDLDALIHERKDEITKLTKEIETIEKKLPEQLVALFTRIYKNKHRLGLVQIENQVCFGCYMKIPMQTEIDIKYGNDIQFCPSCSRILYYDEMSA